MQKYTVLYVDDEEINLRVFRNTFRRDFNILTAQSAMEGIKLLQTNVVNIVITDQRMPEITGVEFLKMINDMFPQIPPNRLMLSGFSKTEDIDKAFQNYKLFQFILKPWDAEELKAIIINAIDHGAER
jgi:response regulator RpfG family c-di-GMP phosphodiesterase